MESRMFKVKVAMPCRITLLIDKNLPTVSIFSLVIHISNDGFGIKTFVKTSEFKKIKVPTQVSSLDSSLDKKFKTNVKTNLKRFFIQGLDYSLEYCIKT